MMGVILDLLSNYGNLGVFLAVVIIIVILFDKRLAKRDQRIDELADVMLETIKENSQIMAELSTIIKSRR